MSASTITVDKVQPNIATYTTLSSALLQSPVITGGLGLQVTKTADYAILDNDYYSNILVDPSARAINITLPAASSNTNRAIFIKVTTKGGNVTITGTIDGGNLYLNRQYDYAEVVSNGTNWNIKRCFCSYCTGFINTNDWTNRHLGSMQITYSGASGAFVVGELITESTSGNTWVITADSGTVFTCKEATGTGHATNARTLTGTTSAKTATVNGTTKNMDSYLEHGLNTTINNIICRGFLADTAATTSLKNMDDMFYDGSVYGTVGAMYQEISSTQIKCQTASGGIGAIDDNGSQAIYNSGDVYYYFILSYYK